MVKILEKKREKICIFRPELPPLVLSAGLNQKPNKCRSKYFHTKVLLHTKYEGKFLMAIFNFAQALATFVLRYTEYAIPLMLTENV